MHVSVTRAALLLGYLQTVLTISLPHSSGPYETTIQSVQITDEKRTDPSSPNNEHRKLMISIFTPVSKANCNHSLVPYVDPITAAFQDEKFAAYGIPPGLFGSLELQVCNLSRHSKKSNTNFPLVILSPALATTRLFYNALAQQISSSGYIVISVDHPYDVDIVTFPDNSTILGLDIPDEALPSALNTRVKDISLVLNYIDRPSNSKNLFPTLQCGPDVSKVGVIGHSFGGAAAAEAMLFDSRLVAGINLDGTFFGQVAEKGLKKPFMIFAHEGKNLTTDYSWEAIWPKLTGWKRELMIAGAQHYAFSDLPAIVKLFGIDASQLLGPIDGERVQVVVGTYVAAFFDKFLKKVKGKVLDRKSADFPEVSFGSK